MGGVVVIGVQYYVRQEIHFIFIQNDSTEEVEEALDSRGIPGWDRVDALAEALLGLSGLSVTRAAARTILELYQKLEDFDKRPLTFRPRPQKPPRGRFGRSKGYRSGHSTIDNMKRYTLPL